MLPPPPPAAAAASPSPFLDSVHALCAHSDALADFLLQCNSLLSYLDSIMSSVSTRLASLPSPAPKHEPKSKPNDPPAAVLGLICEQMGARALRRFVTARVRDRAWLLRVGPGALRRAPDPAALVLRAVGRFYIRAECADAAAACELLLEMYVRAGCPRRAAEDAELRAEAREAALSWRSRMVRVWGRVGAAGASDARGLALLMAAFGVPDELPCRELYELMHIGGGVRAIAEVLRYSRPFANKIPDVVSDMLDKEMYPEAIDLICAFELQDTFLLVPLLRYILQKVIQDRKEGRREGQCSSLSSREYDEQELMLLKSISRCVEDKKLGSSKISSFRMAKGIAGLEEYLATAEELTNISKEMKRRRTKDEEGLLWNIEPKRPYSAAASTTLEQRSTRPAFESSRSCLAPKN